MDTLLITLHVIITVVLILVVLIQSGRGAEISASFGGSSQTVFGSSGGANFFTIFTAVTAALFMVSSIVLTVRGSRRHSDLMAGESGKPVATSTTQPADGAAPDTEKTQPENE